MNNNQKHIESVQTIGKLLSGQLHLPSFILPLLVLNVTFSSKPVFPDSLFHHSFSLIFIIIAVTTFYRTCNYKTLAIGIIVTLVLIRVLRFIYAEQGDALEAIYYVPYCFILLAVGTKMLKDYPYLMMRQIIWISAISVILSLLQIMGVQWAQSLTNYYWYDGGSNYSYLFVQWANLPTISGLQIRPVGFASANNVVSQYLLFFYAFSILWFTGDKYQYRPSFLSVFIISFACALTGAKIIVFVMVMVNIVALFYVERKMRVILFALTTCFAYLIYWLLFPGVFVYNFNIDLFIFNVMVRFADLLNRLGITYIDSMFSFLSQYQTGEYIGIRNVKSTVENLGVTHITGIGSVIKYWSILFPIVLSLLPFWFIQLRKLSATPRINIQKLSLLMMVAALASTAGGPFLMTSYFWFFFSFALYPLSVLILKNRQEGSRLLYVNDL